MNCNATFHSLIVLLGCFCFALSSCMKEPPHLNRADKKQVDSLFNAERKILLKELDSICNTHFDEQVQLAVDSIMEKRMKEIERLKGSRTQNQQR